VRITVRTNVRNTVRNNIMKKLIPAASLALVLGASSFGNAADKAPLSSLPILPKPTLLKDTKAGVPGLTSSEQGTGMKYIEIKADTKSGYCIVGRDYGLRLTAMSSYNPTEEEVWRFQEDKEKKKATLERIGYDLPMGEKNVHTKSTKTVINLARLAETPRVTVWGFREANGDITVLSRNATDGRETGIARKDEGDGSLKTTSSECTFGAVRLIASQISSGGVAQLRGQLPAVGEGKSKVIPRFSIDLSIAKLGRDPEPILSVRVRETEI
jgi:hypothetical protein